MAGELPKYPLRPDVSSVVVDLWCACHPCKSQAPIVDLLTAVPCCFPDLAEFITAQAHCSVARADQARGACDPQSTRTHEYAAYLDYQQAASLDMQPWPAAPNKHQAPSNGHRHGARSSPPSGQDGRRMHAHLQAGLVRMGMPYVVGVGFGVGVGGSGVGGGAGAR